MRMLPAPRSWLTSARLASVYQELELYPTPVDSPTTHAQGLDADRILIVGGGLAVGWGVRTYDLTLAGYLARHISAMTGRGTEIHVRASAHMTCTEALEVLRSVHLDRYEAVILTLGNVEAASMMAPKRWADQLGKVIDLVHEHVTASTLVFTMAIPPVSEFPPLRNGFGHAIDRHAALLNAHTRALVETREKEIFLEVPDLRLVPSDDSFTGYPAGYERYGRAMAPDVAAALDSVMRPVVDLPVEYLSADLPTLSHAAVEELGLLRDGTITSYDAAIDLARRVFRTSVVVCVADEQRLWLVAKDGIDIEVTQRRGTIAEEIIRSGRPLVIEDAHSDPRYATTRFVTGDPYTRFFAAEPIKSPSGDVIGAICLVSPTPRTFSDLDQIVLREMSRVLEHELFNRFRAIQTGQPVTE